MPRPLYVSKPILPDINDFQSALRDIWSSKILTNNGPYHQSLEVSLKSLLSVPTAKVFNNGTIALITALKMFDFPPGSEVITTPLTFAATAHSIAWMGLKPVFVDVSPLSLTIDPACVEKAITPNTAAIMGVHVYGTLCDLDKLQAIASRYKLKLIYDAAHAFAATIYGRSIASFGDASVFSFHATKLFHTIEGGLITCVNPDYDVILDRLRNFGIKNEEEVTMIGINGKLNEIQAVMGLLNLKIFSTERQARKALRTKYNDFLQHLPGITLQPEQDGVDSSEQYFPILIDKDHFGRSRDDIYECLKSKGIFARKYFHPICTDFTPYKDWQIISFEKVPYINSIKDQLLCLPFHSGVDDADIDDIESVFSKKYSQS